jgi:uncharacterized phage-associated protein
MPIPLSSPAVSVVLDVAVWFLDRARASDGHLPAQKLQNLIYLACVHFERDNDGRPLMPATFVANGIAVVDPNLYRLFEDGRPKVRVEPVPANIEGFLGGIWDRYGHFSVERLNTMVERALDGSLPTAVPVEPMPKAAIVEASPALRPTHRGRQVSVAPWRPPTVTARPSK